MDQLSANPHAPSAIRRLGASVARQTRTAGRALARPSLRTLLITYFVHICARKGSRVAIVIFAFDAGGVRPAAVIAAAQTLTAAVVAPVAAGIGDRLRPTTAWSLGFAAQGVGLVATGLAMVLGASLPVVGVLAALTGATFSLTRPVLLTLLPDVAEHPDELTLGNAATAWVDGAASFVGPLLAAALVLISSGATLLAFGAGCVAATALGLRIPLQRLVPPPPVYRTRDLLLDGARELQRDPDAARLTGLVTLQYMVVGLLDVLIVVLVVDVLGRASTTATLMAAAIGLGSAAGGAGSILMTGRQGMRKELIAGALITGLPVVALGIAGSLGPAAALLVVYGVGKSLVTVASQTLLQRSVRDDVTARVFGVNEGLIQLGMAIGSLLGPLLVLALGAHAAFAIAGALMPLAALLIMGSLRRLDARSVVPAPIYDKLRAIPFLTPLPLRTLEQLARTSGRMLAEAGSTIVEQGDEGHQYFVVADGRLDVVVDGRRVRRLETGDGFGEIALLRDTPRTASVVADTPCDLVTIERAAFRSAILGVPTSADRASDHVTGWLESDARRAANRSVGS